MEKTRLLSSQFYLKENKEILLYFASIFPVPAQFTHLNRSKIPSAVISWAWKMSFIMSYIAFFLVIRPLAFCSTFIKDVYAEIHNPSFWSITCCGLFIREVAHVIVGTEKPQDQSPEDAMITWLSPVATGEDNDVTFAWGQMLANLWREPLK